MKVILLQDIRTLGSKHDVKDVADGYARNFLFPNKLAEPATPGALKKLTTLKSKMDKDEMELVKRLTEIARRLNETALDFELKADESGTAYGSVTKEMILSALREHGFVTKERAEVELDRPLKDAGEHKVRVNLKKGTTAELTVRVRKQK